MKVGDRLTDQRCVQLTGKRGLSGNYCQLGDVGNLYPSVGCIEVSFVIVFLRTSGKLENNFFAINRYEILLYS